VCAALPLGATAFVLAQRYKLLEAETSTGAVISTLVSVFTVSLVMLLLSQTARAEENAWKLVQGGGQVLFIRHATTTPGVGDPPGFRLEDCATQRNLSAKGRAEADRAGAALRREHITVGKLLSSPWCRCMDTARLMDVGAVETAPAFSNIVVLSDRRAELTEAGRNVLRAWKGPGVLLVVTHGANIQALIGGPNPASGEIVVVRLAGDGAVREIGRLAVPQG